MVHLKYSEAQEVVPWLMSKLGQFKGESAVILPSKQPEVRLESAKQWQPVGPDPFAGRSASQTVKVELGNPDLVNSAPMQSADGKQKILGIETMDLAQEMKRQGIPLLR